MDRFSEKIVYVLLGLHIADFLIYLIESFS